MYFDYVRTYVPITVTVKTASPVARRLYGSHTPWRAEVDNCDRKMEKDDDITRSRYIQIRTSRIDKSSFCT